MWRNRFGRGFGPVVWQITDDDDYEQNTVQFYSLHKKHTVRPFTLVVKMMAYFIRIYNIKCSRSQWPCGLSRRSMAARLLGLWVRIPPGVWMSACCECCVLSGRGLCDGLITRPVESYWVWCVVECDLETSWMRRSWPTGGCSAKRKKIYIYVYNTKCQYKRHENKFRILGKFRSFFLFKLESF